MKKVGLLSLALLLALGAVGGGLAYFSDSATLTTIFTAGEWELGGSPGFWKTWDEHNTYREWQIEDWLGIIGGESDWLVPDVDEDHDIDIDIDDMEAILQGAEGGTMEEKFLRQYLATRLNTQAGRLYPDAFHDFSIHDSINYLGLGRQGTLQKIITAIEGKYGTSPSEDQFGIIKDVCEAVNKLEI